MYQALDANGKIRISRVSIINVVDGSLSRIAAIGLINASRVSRAVFFQARGGGL